MRRPNPRRATKGASACDEPPDPVRRYASLRMDAGPGRSRAVGSCSGSGPDGLVLTTETSWILGTGSAPEAPPELFDSAVNSWVNAPLLNEPVLPDEPATIALQGSVDRVSLGHGPSIAALRDGLRTFPMTVSSSRAAVRSWSRASTVGAVDRRRGEHARSAHPRSLRLVDIRPTEGLHWSRQDGVPRQVRHVEEPAAISGGFDVFERPGHPYVQVQRDVCRRLQAIPDRNVNLMFVSLQDSFIES